MQLEDITTSDLTLINFVAEVTVRDHAFYRAHRDRTGISWDLINVVEDDYTEEEESQGLDVDITYFSRWLFHFEFPLADNPAALRTCPLLALFNRCQNKWVETNDQEPTLEFRLEKGTNDANHHGQVRQAQLNVLMGLNFVPQHWHVQAMQDDAVNEIYNHSLPDTRRHVRVTRRREDGAFRGYDDLHVQTYLIPVWNRLPLRNKDLNFSRVIPVLLIFNSSAKTLRVVDMYRAFALRIFQRWRKWAHAKAEHRLSNKRKGYNLRFQYNKRTVF